jgi:hypothetical protein
VQLASKQGNFPADVVARAQSLGPALRLGAYTPSTGNEHVRRIVAEAISRRDGHPCDMESVYISSVPPPPLLLGHLGHLGLSLYSTTERRKGY